MGLQTLARLDLLKIKGPTLREVGPKPQLASICLISTTSVIGIIQRFFFSGFQMVVDYTDLLIVQHQFVKLGSKFRWVLCTRFSRQDRTPQTH